MQATISYYASGFGGENTLSLNLSLDLSYVSTMFSVHVDSEQEDAKHSNGAQIPSAGSLIMTGQK